MAPWRLTRPKVGRSPVTPQRVEGDTIEPQVSLPIAKPTSPAAVVGRRPSGRAKYSTDFCSLLVGAEGPEAYACLPMPFREGAVLRFENRSKSAGVKLWEICRISSTISIK